MSPAPPPVLDEEGMSRMANPDVAPLLDLTAVADVGRDFDDVPVALVRLTARLELLAGNRAWHALAAPGSSVRPDGWLDAFDAPSQRRVIDELGLVEAGAPPLVVPARGSDGTREFELRATASGAGPDGPPHVTLAILDVTEQAQREASLAFDASHDDLTGLLNRAALFPVLEQALARHHRRGDILAVLFIDLDHFKQVNDRYGHAAGDEVLRTIGRRLRRAARVEDTVARIGGDEFAVFCEGLTERDEAVRVAARLVAAAARPFEGPAANLSITATVGIAFAGDDDDTPRSLLEAADVAMYDARALHLAAAPAPTVHAKVGSARGSDAVSRRLLGLDNDVARQWRLALSSAEDGQAARWSVVSKHVREALAVVRGSTRI